MGGGSVGDQRRGSRIQRETIFSPFWGEHTSTTLLCIRKYKVAYSFKTERRKCTQTSGFENLLTIHN